MENKVADEQLQARNLPYLEGQGDLLSSLIRGLTGFTISVIGVINLLTKSP